MSVVRAALLSAAASVAVCAAAGAEDSMTPFTSQVQVAYDQSTVVRLDRAAKTVVVGNPSIADAMLVSDKLVYVQGRMFGLTNIIALDAAGAEILNTRVMVGAANVGQVTLYRGPSGQQNMACSPRCERTVTQGDKEMDIVYKQADEKIEVTRKSADLASPQR